MFGVITAKDSNKFFCCLKWLQLKPIPLQVTLFTIWLQYIYALVVINCSCKKKKKAQDTFLLPLQIR